MKVSFGSFATRSEPSRRLGEMPMVHSPLDRRAMPRPTRIGTVVLPRSGHGEPTPPARQRRTMGTAVRFEKRNAMPMGFRCSAALGFENGW